MIKILDCTLRDGGYYTNWDFDKNLVDTYIKACNDLPVDYLEVGYAVDTVMAIMKYAFEELGLNRLDGSMIEYNVASLKMYIGKCGWKEEGRQRNWYFRKNQYWDRIMVGITKEDYFELIEKNGYWK